MMQEPQIRRYREYLEQSARTAAEADDYQRWNSEISAVAALDHVLDEECLSAPSRIPFHRLIVDKQPG